MFIKKNTYVIVLFSKILDILSLLLNKEHNSEVKNLV